MKGEEIVQRATLYVGDQPDSEDALTMINEALTIIGDKAGVYGTVTVEVISTNEWYQLPLDTVVLESIEAITGANFEEFETRALMIRFKQTGTFIINARRMAPQIVTLLDDIALHQLFLQAIVTYVRGFMKLKDNDQSADGKELKEQFYGEVERAATIVDQIRKRVR